MSANFLYHFNNYIFKATVSTFIALFICTVNAETSITCPSTIVDEIEESVVLIGKGNCNLHSQAKILNDVSVSAGVSFVVNGYVAGKINEVGAGHVEIAEGGLVKDEIIEAGEGSLKILDGALVEGNVNESGAGSIQISSSLIKGDIEESGAGQIKISASTIDGNVLERSAGSVVIIGTVVNNSVYEFANGEVKIDSSSYIVGDVTEEGQGTCNKTDQLVVNGEINCD